MKLHLLPAFALLILIASGFAVEPCASCKEFTGKPTARLIPLMDEDNHTLTVYASYDNSSNITNPRQPLSNTILIVQLTNVTGFREIYKIYTDDNGSAFFDFTFRAKTGCTNFRILYCPFCTPGSPECGFAECINYSKLGNTGYTNLVGGKAVLETLEDITDGPGTVVLAPDQISTARYLPDLTQIPYCAPPEPLSSTPAFCLPLLLIFALLGGALFVTGRNPFAAFNIGGARVGRHLRYQARGRSDGYSAMAYLQAVMSVGMAAQQIGTLGVKGFVGQEWQSVKERGMFFSGEFRRATIGRKAFAAARADVAKAEKAAAAKGKPLTAAQSMQLLQLSLRTALVKESQGGGKAGARMGGGPLGVGAGQQAGPPRQDIGAAAQMIPHVGNLISSGPLGILFLLFTQSNIGSIFNQASMIATGKQLAEHVSDGTKLAKQEREALMKLIDVSVSPDGRKGFGMSYGGIFVVVTGVVTNKDGSYKLDVALPAGAGAANTLDGKGTLHIKADGTLDHFSFISNIPLKGMVNDAKDGEARNGEVIVRFGAGGMPEFLLKYAAGKDGVEKTVQVTDVNTLSALNATLQSFPPGMLGKGAAGLLDAFLEQKQLLTTLATTVQGDYQKLASEAREALADKAGSDPELARQLRPAAESNRDTIARDALVAALGSSGGAFGLDPVSARVGGLVTGKDNNTVVVLDVGNAYSAAGLRDERSDQNPLPAAVIGASGLKTTDPNMKGGENFRGDHISSPMETAVGALLGLTLEQRANMTADGLRDFLAKQGVSVDAIKPANLEKMASAVREAPVDFEKRLIRAGCDPDFVRGIMQANPNSVNAISNTADQLFKPNGDPRDPVSLPPLGGSSFRGAAAESADFRASMFEAASFEGVAKSLGNITRALESGNLEGFTGTAPLVYAAGNVQDTATWTAASINSKDPHMAAQFTSESGQKQSVADFALNGVEKQIEAHQRAQTEGVMNATNANPNVTDGAAHAMVVTQRYDEVNNALSAGDGKTASDRLTAMADYYHGAGNYAAEANCRDMAGRVASAPPESLPEQQSKMNFILTQDPVLHWAVNGRTNVEIDTALAHNDYNTAAQKCRETSDYYRNIGDTKSANAYDNAYGSIMGFVKPAEAGPIPASTDALRRDVNHDISSAGDPNSRANFAYGASVMTEHNVEVNSRIDHAILNGDRGAAFEEAHGAYVRSRDMGDENAANYYAGICTQINTPPVAPRPTMGSEAVNLPEAPKHPPKLTEPLPLIAQERDALHNAVWQSPTNVMANSSDHLRHIQDRDRAGYDDLNRAAGMVQAQILNETKPKK